MIAILYLVCMLMCGDICGRDCCELWNADIRLTDRKCVIVNILIGVLCALQHAKETLLQLSERYRWVPSNYGWREAVYVYLLWVKHGSIKNSSRNYEKLYDIPKTCVFKLVKWGNRIMKGFHLKHLTPLTFEQRAKIAKQRLECI